jgi:hypothetical protein
MRERAFISVWGGYHNDIFEADFLLLFTDKNLDPTGGLLQINNYINLN